MLGRRVEFSGKCIQLLFPFSIWTFLNFRVTGFCNEVGVRDNSGTFDLVRSHWQKFSRVDVSIIIVRFDDLEGLLGGRSRARSTNRWFEGDEIVRVLVDLTPPSSVNSPQELFLSDTFSDVWVCFQVKDEIKRTWSSITHVYSLCNACISGNTVSINFKDARIRWVIIDVLGPGRLNFQADVRILVRCTLWDIDSSAPIFGCFSELGELSHLGLEFGHFYHSFTKIMKIKKIRKYANIWIMKKKKWEVQFFS